MLGGHIKGKKSLVRIKNLGAIGNNLIWKIQLKVNTVIMVAKWYEQGY